MIGTVKYFEPRKGFGFIVPQDGSKDLFFHVSECSPEDYMPKENDVVSFTEGSGKEGRPSAKAVSQISNDNSTIPLDDEDME